MPNGKSLQASSNPLYEESLPHTHHPSVILQVFSTPVYHQHASECLGYRCEPRDQVPALMELAFWQGEKKA